MILTLTYKTCRLNLKQSFTSATGSYNYKDAVFIFLSNGISTGIGEASPLPLFNTETIENVVNELKILSGKQIFITENPTSCKIIELVNSITKLPSLRFALEQCFFNLLPQNFPLLADTNSQININAIIGFKQLDETLSAVGSLLQTGFSTLKIKVGRKNFETDFQIICKVRENFGFDFNLRLDANCNWNFNHVPELLERLQPYKIEYIEQPVKKISELIILNNLALIPVAIDESAVNFSYFQFCLSEGIKYFVIKPARFGGIFSTLELITEIKANDAKCIISSSFESSIGMQTLFILAAQMSISAHGLSLLNIFENEPLPQFFMPDLPLVNFSNKLFKASLGDAKFE